MVLAWIVLVPAVVTVVATAPPAAQPATAASTTDLLVGDSVMAGMSSSARASLPHHRFDASVCRRLVATSCSYQGTRPSTAMSVIRTNAGAIDRAIVVAAGYNDSSIAGAVDEVIAEARRQGVPHVVWLTYRIAGRYADNYRSFNDTLWSKAAQYPELRIADWAGRSAGRGEWVASDGLHLNGSGARAMAQLIGETLDSLAPPPPTRCDLADGGEGAPPLSQGPNTQPEAGLVMHPGPRRLADTRADAMLRAGHVLRVPLPDEYVSQATAAVITLTGVDPCGPGYLTAFACGSTRPPTSTVNVRSSGATANMTIVPVGQRAFCVYASVSTDVVVDLVGHLGEAGTGVDAIEAERIFDSRGAAPNELVSWNGLLPAGRVTTIPVTASELVDDDAEAVMVNLTSTESTRSGFVTSYPGPCSVSPPTASNLNHAAGETIAVGAITRVGSDGTVCVYNHAETHLVVDLTAVVGDDGARLRTVKNLRLTDTRATSGAASGDLGVPTTAGGAPDDHVGAIVNVVGLRDGRGFVTARACGRTGPPEHSTLNHRDGAAANVAIAPVDDGRTCIYRQPAAHVVVDAVAWLVP